ncbi:MAG: sugar ABC transporter ATP-binding protein [Cellulosilyticaceae bacterium]
MANEYVLEMLDIEKQFPGVKALDGAQLKLRKGTVHSLMGENGAGKSTLMKCLFGIYHEDAGSIKIDGKEIRFNNPKQALESGVAMVHQELNQVLRRSVMENMWIGRFPMKGPFIDQKKMYNDTVEIFKDLNIEVDPKALIGKLSVSERQMVEIAKAVSYNAKILVLDEPTSSLTRKEVEHLFTIIERLKKRDVGMIYISHKMEEILQISEDVTIMRDGKWIVTKSAEGLTTNEIIKYMVGRSLTERFPPKTNVVGEPLLEVKNLTGKHMPTCKDVTFNLHKGEIVGVAGLVGSRRTEVLETIFGIAKRESGQMLLHGKEVKNKNAKEAIQNGFALLTEERRATGIIPLRSITFNTAIANLNSYKKFGFLSDKKMEEDTKWVIESMKVKTPTSKTYIKTLSGGNQQKVILGRWLLTKPEVLLLDEPTRGIDVGAKYEIYQLIIDLANKGKGVMVVSSEMPELIGICDRILVMSNGRLAGEVDMKTVSAENAQEEIMKLAAKYI